MLCSGTQAHAGLTINATFDSSITSLPDAAAIEGAINAAISVLEADISESDHGHDRFPNMTGGLGQSTSGIYAVTYFDYYNALKAPYDDPGPAHRPRFAGTGSHVRASRNPVNGST